MRKMIALLALAVLLAACAPNQPLGLPTLKVDPSPTVPASATPALPTPIPLEIRVSAPISGAPLDITPETITLLNDNNLAPLVFSDGKSGLASASIHSDGSIRLPALDQIISSSGEGVLVSQGFNSNNNMWEYGITTNSPSTDVVLGKLPPLDGWNVAVGVIRGPNPDPRFDASMSATGAEIVVIYNDNTILFMGARYSPNATSLDADGFPLIDGKHPSVYDKYGNQMSWEAFQSLLHPAIEYQVGRDAEGNIPVNQVDLQSRFQDTNNDGKVDVIVIPPEQLASEQAWLDAHPEVTGGGNYVGNTVDGSDILPYRTLSMRIERNNMIAINIDDSTGYIEIVFAQKATGSDSRAIVHVFISPEAQDKWLNGLNDPASMRPSTLNYGDNLQNLIIGKAQRLSIAPFMNSLANPALVNDPAFARVKEVVEVEGDDAAVIVDFTNSKYGTTEQFLQWANIILRKLYISPYAIIP